MTSKEALEIIKIIQTNNYNKRTNDYINVNEACEYEIDIIEKELKALEIIKNKKVNVFNIWVFDNYTQYKKHYPFSEYNAKEDMLTCGEFVLLKEVIE